MRYPARLVSADPSVLLVGAVQLNVADPVAGASLTVMEKAGRDAVACPSDTRITMFEYVPT